MCTCVSSRTSDVTFPPRASAAVVAVAVAVELLLGLVAGVVPVVNAIEPTTARQTRSVA